MTEKTRYSALDKIFRVDDEDFKTPAHDELWLKCQEPKILIDIIKTAFPTMCFLTRRLCTYCASACGWDWTAETQQCKENNQRKVNEDYTKFVSDYRSRFPSDMDFLLHTKEMILEKPICASNGFIVGFIDIFINLESVTWDSEASYFRKILGSTNNKRSLFIEVKPTIKSIGETIRQMMLYKHYLPNSAPVLVTSQKMDTNVFASQGIVLYHLDMGAKNG